MKRSAIIICLFLAAAATVPAKAIRDDLNFAGDAARASYAFGMMVGDDLMQAGLEIDYPAFMEGLRAIMESRPTILEKDQALEMIQDAMELAAKRQALDHAEKEELFLQESASQPGIIRTESGLQYMVIEEGAGPKPTIEDTVLVHYEGSLIDGTVFDSSFEREEPEDIPLKMVIPGWSEGILLMNVGSKYRFIIPSNLAYGERGAGRIIPPYSPLIFTVELLDIVKFENVDIDEEEDLNSEG